MKEDVELPPTEYGVSSLKRCALIGDEDLSSPWLNEGDAHRGRVRMYNFAISTGEPTSSSITCSQKISSLNATNNIIHEHAPYSPENVCLSFLRKNKTITC